MKKIIKNQYPVIAVILFVLIIILAHIFSTQHYNWTQHTISHLGAQGYARKVIMQIGFLIFGSILGLGILGNGLSWRRLPIFIYGICVALTGIFCTQPFFDSPNYSFLESTLHSTFAQIAGLSFSIGIIIQMFFTNSLKIKSAHFLFFLLTIGFSALFGLLEENQGIAQRLLYITSFIWLTNFYKP